MTRQEIFDKVVRHLAEQGKQASVPGHLRRPICKYRTPEGLSCAVGCMIEDEHYHAGLETEGVFDHPIIEAVGRSIGRELDCLDCDLLCDLQCIHDDPLNWKRLDSRPLPAGLAQELRRVARGWGLNANVVNEIRGVE